MCQILAVGLAPSKSNKYRRAVYSAASGEMTVCQGKDSKDFVTYRVTEITGVGFPARAFSLVKVAGGSDKEAADYAVLLDPNPGRSTCECRGFLRHGNCKHIDSLTDLLAAGAFDPDHMDVPADMDLPAYPYPSARQLEDDADHDLPACFRNLPPSAIRCDDIPF